MASFWAKRDASGLIPTDAESWAVLAKVPFGKLVYVEVKQPRNGRHLRWFWVITTRIASAIGCNVDALASHLKVRTGHVNIIKTKDGIKEYPASISYASMPDESKFQDFTNRCVQVIVEDLGMKRPDVLDAIKDVLDGPVERRS